MRPLAEAGGGDGAQDIARDAEVVDGGFPRPQRVAGELDALFGPGAEVVFGEDGQQFGRSLGVGGGEGG